MTTRVATSNSDENRGVPSVGGRYWGVIGTRGRGGRSLKEMSVATWCRYVCRDVFGCCVFYLLLLL